MTDSETKVDSWWVGLSRPAFAAQQGDEERRMRNTKLERGVSLALQATELLEEAELRGFNTPRVGRTRSASTTPAPTPSRSKE